MKSPSILQAKPFSFVHLASPALEVSHHRASVAFSFIDCPRPTCLHLVASALAKVTTRIQVVLAALTTILPQQVSDILQLPSVFAPLL